MRTVNTMTWAQRCATDAEARDWHLEYGRSEFYYSDKWGQLTAIADGTTTVTDVADALAAGTATPYQQALAASFWLDAADYLAVRAMCEVADARRGYPHEGLTDDLGQVPWLVDDDELAAAEQRQAAADAALAGARQIRDAAVEREDDARRWQEAEDEAAYHEAGARAALVAEVTGPWRTAVDVEYDQICAEYGNDGHPENDRHISAQDKAAQAAAVAAIAARTGLPTEAVWDAVREVSEGYARDHTDTATLGQPDWDQVAGNWANVTAQQQTYWEDAESEAAAGRGITGTYRDMGWTAEQIAAAEDGMTVEAAQKALDQLAEYEAAIRPVVPDVPVPPTGDQPVGGLGGGGDPPEDLAAQRAWAAWEHQGTHRADGMIQEGMAAPAGALPMEPPPLSQQDKAATAKNTRSHQIDDIDEAEFEWWTTPPTPDEWAAAEARLDRATAGGVADPGAWAAWSELHARAGNVGAAVAATGSQMADEDEVARLHREGAELSPEQQEWVEGDAARDDGPPAPTPADVDDDGDAEPAPVRDTRTPAERATDAWAAGQMSEYAQRAADGTQAPVAQDATETTSRSADPVLWGSVAAELLDELDQARAQLDAGDVPPEREHELAQHIEHLEDQTAHYAQTPTELGTTTDALLTELDTTAPDLYPGDHSPYWDHHDEPLATAPQQPGDEPAAPHLHGADADAWGVAEGTPVAQVPASYHEWVAEGRPAGQAPAQAPHADLVTAPHDTEQAKRPRPAHEQASSPQDNAPATDPPELAAGPDGSDLAAGPGTGEDPIVRARHALARLDASRKARADRDHPPPGCRGVEDTPTRSASAGMDPPALGPREPGW